MGYGASLEMLEDAGDAGLYVRRDGIFAIAVAVEVRATAEAAHDALAQCLGLPARHTIEQTLHATSYHNGCVGSKALTGVALTSRGQHDIVVNDRGGHHRSYAVAQASFVQGTFLLETQRPIAGRIIIG